MAFRISFRNAFQNSFRAAKHKAYHSQTKNKGPAEKAGVETGDVIVEFNNLNYDQYMILSKYMDDD